MPKLTEEQRLAAEEAIRATARTVRFDVTEFTVDYLVGQLRAERYYVPEYQRNMVWNDNRQSEFIESVLIGLPIPFLFYYEDEHGKYEIVDGSQRLRTLRRFMDGDLKLRGLELLDKLNGFRFADLTEARQQKFANRSIRGIVLEEGTDPETRTEMFRRINTGGSQANEAEIRRGSLPGLFNDLVLELSKHEKFVEMTPLSAKLVREREREELVTRFFVYFDGYGEQGEFVGYRDDPRKYIYAWVKNANLVCALEPERIDRYRQQFDEMLSFVDQVFPNGFRKTPTGKQVPRVRFEAIAVGSALALSRHPDLDAQHINGAGIVEDEAFLNATKSDAANNRARLVGRIDTVLEKLVEQ